MRRESRSRIDDAIRSIEAISVFVQGKTARDYESDLLLQSAVERQLTILGEALGALRRDDPGLAERIPNVAAAVGLRNALVHGYEAIDDHVIWMTVRRDLPPLIDHLRAVAGQ